MRYNGTLKIRNLVILMSDDRLRHLLCEVTSLSDNDRVTKGTVERVYASVRPQPFVSIEDKAIYWCMNYYNSVDIDIVILESSSENRLRKK